MGTTVIRREYGLVRMAHSIYHRCVSCGMVTWKHRPLARRGRAQTPDRKRAARPTGNHSFDMFDVFFCGVANFKVVQIGDLVVVGPTRPCRNRSQGTREPIPGVGTNHRGLERLFHGVGTDRRGLESLFYGVGPNRRGLERLFHGVGTDHRGLESLFYGVGRWNRSRSFGLAGGGDDEGRFELWQRVGEHEEGLPQGEGRPDGNGSGRPVEHHQGAPRPDWLLLWAYALSPHPIGS
eukprot:9120451-Pyramimonas_sp.AAC.3